VDATTSTTTSTTSTTTSTTSTTTSTTSTTSTSSTTTTTTTNICADCVTGTELQIGTQTWLACNLNVDTYRNGDPIYHATDPTDWTAKGNAGIGAWCYYDNDPANGPIYGKIYNWHAANDTTHGGIGPAGYHLPSSTEWDTLYSTINALSPVGNTGGKMKSTCPNHWTFPGWPTNVDATNQSGFRGLGAGFRNLEPYPDFGPSGFGYLGLDETWWESTTFDSSRAYGRYLRKNTGIAYRDDYPMRDGYSIRLIKDQ
jgi:uncharacterized protein (TIGR02145 family)